MALNKQESYKIDPGNKLALIINVEDERPGAENDTPRLQTALEGCGFQVFVPIDYTYEGIKEAIKVFKKSLKEKHAVCSLVAIMSHGNDSVAIRTLSGKLKFTTDIFSPFNDDECPYMVGKPKIFLGNFCRSWTTAIDSNVGQDLWGWLKFWESSPLKSDLDGDRKFSDMLVCFSTVDDNPAYRDPDKGTWYIQSFVKAINKLANGKTEIRKIMDEVFKDNHCMGQCAPYTSLGFIKNLYLKHESIPSPDETVKASKLVDVFLRDSQVIGNLAQFFEDVFPGVPKHLYLQKIKIAPIIGEEKQLICGVVSAWVSRTTHEDATVEKLIKILEEKGYMNVVGDLLKTEWGDARIISKLILRNKRGAGLV